MKHEVFLLEGSSAEPFTVPVESRRIAAAKRSFVTRRVDLDLAAGLIVAGASPKAGDIVLARIEHLGHHKKLEEPGGRRSTLFIGDEILVAYGDRYAPDQFEAHVPDDLKPCDLVAGGGIASRVLRQSTRVGGATRIAPVGLVTDASGRRLNVRDFAMGDPLPPFPKPLIVAVVGSSMNAGKTTAIASLAHGERLAGRRVGAVKVTGTGAGGDLWAYRDAGAEVALDFTDAGYATTHRISEAERELILETLVARAAAEGMETILVEVADGLLLTDTERLVRSPTFRKLVDGVIFAAADAMSALGGALWLERNDLPFLALTGAVTASPLAISEIGAQTPHPVLTVPEMVEGRMIVSEMVLRRCAA